MSRSSDTFQVLVTSGDQDLLAKDQAISALAVGQLGVFSYKDNVSVDETSTDLATRGRDFYVAVGVDPLGGTTLGDINKSAGTHIQARNVVNYSASCYTPPQQKIIELLDYTAACNTEYGIKFEIRNQQAYRVNGFNQVMKSFVAKTDDCTGCEDCPTGNCVGLAKQLVADINADSDGLILAEFIGYVGEVTVTVASSADGTATITLGSEAAVDVALLDADLVAGVATKIAAAINGVADSVYSATATDDVVTIYGPAAADITWAAGTATDTAVTESNIVKAVVADADVFAAGAPTGTCLGLRFTIQPKAVETFCAINLNYFSPRQTDVIATKIAGFESVGTLTTTQDLIYEKNSGYDVKQLEYEAGGWNGRPGVYRTSELLGMPREGFNYFADAAAKYNVINLGYDQASIAGFGEHRNPLRTVIAIPVASDTARDAIIAVFDAIVTNAEPLAAFIANCPTDGTTVFDTNSVTDSYGDSISTS